MSDTIKGRFVFLPEDGTEAYEIDLDTILAISPWWKRVITFLQSFRKEKTRTDLPVVPNIDLPDMVCAKLEELFSTAEWHHRDESTGYSVACHILQVAPRMHAEGYEPIVSLTLNNGTIQDITLADLLTHYVPYAPPERDKRYEH